MANNQRSPRDQNRIPAILVEDTITLKATAASGILAGTVEAQAMAIVDGSGTQITSFGGGTQYTDGGTPPTHPIGPTLEFNNAGTWATVGSANPLPVSGSFSLTNPTVGLAVPTTANYIAASKAGTLTGILLGSQTSANSQAVVLASDQASIPVAATLTAETTKVIGVVRNADGSGNLLTSTGNALDINIKTGNPTTMTVTQATGSNLHTVIDAGTNNIGLVTPTPTSNSGWSFNYQASLSSTKAQIKATAGTFGGFINLYNPNTTVTYIQVFNKASASVTVGTTAPDFVITLAGVATASATGSDRNLEITCGLAMSTGITIAATTTATGSTAPANAITATFLFL